MSLSTAIVEAGVVVIGAGFSGLMAAYQLHQAGLKTVVLEARDRVGGRSRSVKRQSGPGIIELGATWINNVTQPEVYALTQKFGLETSAQYTEGEQVFETLNRYVRRVSQENATWVTSTPSLFNIMQLTLF